MNKIPAYLFYFRTSLNKVKRPDIQLIDPAVTPLPRSGFGTYIGSIAFPLAFLTMFLVLRKVPFGLIPFLVII